MMKHLDFEQTTVPVEQRRPYWAMFMVMLGFTFFSASMYAGATLGSGLSLKNFLIAMLCGNLILGIYTGILAWIAGSTGLSLHLLSRFAFGSRGSWLPSFLLGITQIGWFGVGVAMFALPVHALLLAKGIHVSIWVPVVISGLMMTSSAYFGIKALTVVSIIAVPAIAVGGGFSALKVFFDNPDAWHQLMIFEPQSVKALTMTAAITLTIGSFISGGTCTPDFVRFAKSRSHAVSTTVIAFFIGNSLMFCFGAVGGMFYDTNDISLVLVRQGLLIPGIIVLGMNIWTTNDNALYTSGLGFANITGLPKRYLVLFNGILGTLFAVTLYNHFCGYLNILNTLIPPIGAILAADFFIIRHCGRDFGPVDELAQQPKVSIAAIVAWLAGALVANFIDAGLPAVNGILTAFVLYGIFRKIRK